MFLIEGMSDFNFTNYLRKIQIWLKLLIETGSYIEENDENWKHILAFEVTEDGFNKFAGMLSFYTFKLSFEKERNRLSQMLVLPHYQRMGLGYFILQVKKFLTFLEIL